MLNIKKGGEMVKKTNTANLHFDLEELMKNGVPAVEFQAITEQIKKEESEKLVDEERLKRDRTWSVLGHQVVGAEVL